MKKIFFYVAILATVAMSASCEKEPATNGRTSSANTVSFTLTNKVTKAGEITSEVKTSQILLDIDEETNTAFFLQESVSSLDDFCAPETKGTPIYTENAIDALGGFTAQAYKHTDDQLASSPYLADAEFLYDEEKNMWRHHYETNPWEGVDASESLWFFMRNDADIDATPALITKDNKVLGQMVFDYTSPTTAADQKDLVFAARSLTKAEAKDAKVLFYHALSAVKFRLANDDETTMINSVKFTGLKNSGKCTITPYYGSGWSVDSNPYSSSTASTKSAASAQWKLGSTTGTFSQSFTELVDFEKEGGQFPASFYEYGKGSNINTNNLNDDDASLTFWFIPQELTDNVKLEVNFTAAGKTKTVTLDFGKLANYPTWGAGEIRTYTIAANEVDITVTDSVTSGNIKKDVKIQNTGNVPVYIRAAIVGYWADVKGGFVNEVWKPLEHGTYVWKDTAGNTISSPYAFVAKGQSTTVPAASYFENNWILAADGYYYYKYQVPAGAETIGKLFDSYTVKSYDQLKGTVNPDVKDAHLEMRIIVQAIQASKLLGSDGTTFKTGDAAFGWNTANFSTETDKK